MADLAHQRVRREEIVEVGNLAAEKPGGTVQVVLALAAHLDRLGYKWVVFTATRELIGIFNRLGLPLLALAAADPGRLGEAAAATWGRYYDTQPIVVAGRIRMALERIGPARMNATNGSPQDGVSLLFAALAERAPDDLVLRGTRQTWRPPSCWRRSTISPPRSPVRAFSQSSPTTVRRG